MERIQLYDSRLHAYISIFPEQALRLAKKAEKDYANGIVKGVLQGVPVAVKDQFDIKGERTTFGSKIFADYYPKHTSTVIERMNQEGAIMLGKLNMTEFAAGAGDPFHYGDPPRNPWNLELDPGSSSTGSGIAIAASLCANS